MAFINSSDYFDLKSLVNKVLTFDSAGIEVLELSAPLKADLLKLEDYDSVLDDAADYGLATGSDRIIRNEKKMPYIEGFWAEKELQAEEDPTIKQQVGLAVCELSGLGDFIGDLLAKKEAEELAELEAKEEAERLEKERIEQEGELIIDGDNLEESTVDAEQMMADRLAAGLPA